MAKAYRPYVPDERQPGGLMTPEEIMNDAELTQLIHDVDELCGEAARFAANFRAADRARDARNGDGDIWLGVFCAAWKDELRRLLRPH